MIGGVGTMSEDGQALRRWEHFTDILVVTEAEWSEFTGIREQDGYPWCDGGGRDQSGTSHVLLQLLPSRQAPKKTTAKS